MTLPDCLTRGSMGEIRLTGHRIDLYQIVLLYSQGQTADMLHDSWESIPFMPFAWGTYPTFPWNRATLRPWPGRSNPGEFCSPWMRNPCRAIGSTISAEDTILQAFSFFGIALHFAK
jgi:hypothetical protein